MAGGR
ncbi:hypothetical protein YPPY60_2197, partial [Yersinia pestis PY-60]